MITLEILLKARTEHEKCDAHPFLVLIKPNKLDKFFLIPEIKGLNV